MKYLIIFLIIVVSIYSCDTSKSTMKGETNSGVTANDTIRIANDSLEYEILIIEPRFSSWVISQPPRGYYGEAYLENKNRLFVSEYNNRVRNAVNRYPADLYPQEINYNPSIHYGYEVNYLLYNYFVFFQKEYNQSFIFGRN